MSLPIPVSRYLPRAFLAAPDAPQNAFTAKIDAILEELQASVTEQLYLHDTARTPAILLDELAYMLAAGVEGGDSEAVKRMKISNAIMGHKNRSTWENDCKMRIDAITAGDSSIMTVVGATSSDWIMVGDGSAVDTYWGAMGEDAVVSTDYFYVTDTDSILVDAGDPSSDGSLGTDNIGDFGWDLMGGPNTPSSGDILLGLDLIGAGTEPEIAGNIYINLGGSGYLALIPQIVAAIETDVVPAYMIIYLGYLDGGGKFVLYSGGIVG